MTTKLVENQILLSEIAEPMGEIRVDVVMVNAIDEGIARRGGMTAKDVRRCTATALVDTGAVRCAVPVSIVEKLGLATTGRSVAEYADGRLDVVEVTEPIRIEIAGRSTIQPALVLGNEILLGQMVLEDTDLWADCKGQRLVPNPAHPDQPVFQVK